MTDTITIDNPPAEPAPTPAPATSTGIPGIVLNATVVLLIGGVALMLLTGTLHRRFDIIPGLGYGEAAIYSGTTYLLLAFVRPALLGGRRA